MRLELLCLTQLEFGHAISSNEDDSDSVSGMSILLELFIIVIPLEHWLLSDLARVCDLIELEEDDVYPADRKFCGESAHIDRAWDLSLPDYGCSCKGHLPSAYSR